MLALVAQLSVELSPRSMLVGLAVKESIYGRTITLAVQVSVPPSFVAVNS